MPKPWFSPQPPYPSDWWDIAETARLRAGHRCCLCGAQGLTPDEYDAWERPENRDRVLDVHHVDGDPANCAEDNLLPLCKRCHRTEHRKRREKHKALAASAAGQQTAKL